MEAATVEIKAVVKCSTVIMLSCSLGYALCFPCIISNRTIYCVGMIYNCTYILFISCIGDHVIKLEQIFAPSLARGLSAGRKLHPLSFSSRASVVGNYC